MTPRSAELTATLGTFAELVRLPAALSVPGDTLAGSAEAGGLSSRGDLARAAVLPLSSVCLYWAGMALNDWADRDLDAAERPERPIPSGRIAPGQALATGAVLTAAGVGIAAVAGGRTAFAIATLLAGTVWAYDTVLKESPGGPVAMAAARGLDVLLGSAGGGRPGAGLAPAALLAAHTASVTVLSRGEVHGTRPEVAGISVGATAVTAAATALRGRGILPAVLAAAYAVTVGRAQAAAVATPDGATVRSATGAGIRGMIPLQAALISRRAPRTALGLLVAAPLAKAASRLVSPT